jgi:type VI secretion system protein ImpM
LGFYGKVPTQGDFVSRRLSRCFLDPWDQWLQRGLAYSREQLSEGWLDIYLTSPLWRFGLTSGIGGKNAWIGILMPSVDRVGRYFPLTLAAPLPEDAPVLEFLATAEAWFSQVERLALFSLEDGFDLESFDNQLQALNGLSTTFSQRMQCASHPPKALNSSLACAWHFDLTSADSLLNDSPAIAGRILKNIFPCYSVWWTSGSEQINPSLAICSGLPAVEGFSALLDGRWKQGGWINYQLFPLEQ